MARQTLWGFGGCEFEYNFCDMARTSRMGENAFRHSCSFRELGVVKRAGRSRDFGTIRIHQGPMR
jgi:hypothetical protein